MKAIFERRSSRKFTEQPVEWEKIESMLGAGMCAPSAGNEKPWQFVVSDKKDILKDMAAVHPYAFSLERASWGILVCGDESLRKYQEDYWVQDCAAATQNILTEAQYLGVGCCWLGVYPTQKSIVRLKEMFGLPEPVIPFCMIAAGYPAEEKRLTDRFARERVHRDGW